MVLKLLIVFVMWRCIFSVSGTFTHKELKILNKLKYSYCGSSRSWLDPSAAEPWFCVERDSCSSDLTYQEGYIIHKTDYCNGNVHSEKNPFCCHIEHITGMEHGFQKKYGVEQKKLDYSTPKNSFGIQFFEEYIKQIYYSNAPHNLSEILKNNRICGLVPTTYKSHLVYYLPMVCTTENECSSIKNNFKLLTNIRRSLDEGAGNVFCENTFSARGKVCCHPAAIKSVIWEEENWEVPVLLPEQTYAHGFRSSFQCEQFGKLMCDGAKNNCPLPSPVPGRSVAGEFPHLALIGISYPRTQYFFCSGTVVSKFKILSTALCIYHDDKVANVALTGDFDLWEYNEKGSSETLSDIIDIKKSPFPDVLDYEMVLFVLRKPLVLNNYLKPACINSKVDFPFVKTTDSGPKTGTFSGFGTVTTMGRWSQYPKKVDNIIISFYSNTKDEKKCVKYTKDFSKNSTFCFERTVNGPCEYDLGAPITYMSNRIICQWIVFAVATTQVIVCNETDTILFSKVSADLAWQWFEEILFSDDFNLFEFQASSPTCGYTNSQLSNTEIFLHLRPRYSDIYPDNYLAPPEDERPDIIMI